MPSTASTSTPCRSAIWCICAAVARRMAPCSSAAPSSSSGIASTSTQPSGPPMTNTMATKITMKGRSEMADSVAEAKNSRTCSTCARWWA